MEDDIDKLLEEVENKFINKNDNRPRKLLKANILSPQSSFRCDSSDYDDILRDEEDNSDSKPMRMKNLRRDYTPVGNVSNRCFPVYLGGSEYCSGYSTLGTPRSCSNLHCISCDFAVSAFDNFQWVSNTDYLFLRTNMPEFERVKDHLLPAKGCRAYACQCQHYSTSTMQQVQNVPVLSWVCRSHSNQSASSL